MVSETKNSSIYSENPVGFISWFFVSVTTQSTKDRELEGSKEKVDTLPVPSGSVCTSESDISDVGEGEEECQSKEDSDFEYNSVTEVDTT